MRRRGRRRVLALALAASLAATPLGCRREAEAPAAPTPRFLVLDADVTRDTTTGLEWTRRDHERALAWDEADRHCRERTGGTWRLPELGEMEGLYDPSRDEPCGERHCRIDPAVALGGPYVWTATSRGVGTRFYFDVAYGNALSPTVTPELVRRVLCVRGRGNGASSSAPLPAASSSH